VTVLPDRCYPGKRQMTHCRQRTSVEFRRLISPGLWRTRAVPLTKNGLLDTDLVLDWLWMSGVWARVGPAALRQREKHGVPELYANFEALAAKQGG
jgi:hypothetical protein